MDIGVILEHLHFHGLMVKVANTNKNFTSIFILIFWQNTFFIVFSLRDFFDQDCTTLFNLTTCSKDFAGIFSTICQVKTNSKMLAKNLMWTLAVK